MRTDTRARRTTRWVTEHALPMTYLRVAALGGDLQARVVTASAAGDHERLEALLARARDHGTLVPGRFAALATRHASVKDCLLYTSPSPRD